MPVESFSQDVVTRITNVQWEEEDFFQVVIGMPADPSPSFGAIPETMSSKDGKEFDTTTFGAATFSGASGLGKTVIGKNYKLVAFGEPRDGDACFIVVDGNWWGGEDNNIQRGVIDPDTGELKWETIGDFPSSNGRGAAASAYSCSFAGGGFFIQYPIIGDTGDIADLVHMSVSFDGKKFEHGIDPFHGVNAHSVCNPDGKDNVDDGLPVGGSVAYDKKNNRYVTTGSYYRTYMVKYLVHGFVTSEFETTSFDINFMSSISIDGLSWTPKFDQSQGDGINNSNDPEKDIGHVSAGTSTVCFSDALGLFVASSTYKDKNLNQDNSDTDNSQEFPVSIEASSVATSPDGVNWTNTLLGPPSTLVYGVGATYSFSYCVAFVKTREAEPGETSSDGFFLVGATKGANYTNTSVQQKGNVMWRSEDGVSWTETRSSERGFPQAMTLVDEGATNDTVVRV